MKKHCGNLDLNNFLPLKNLKRLIFFFIALGLLGSTEVSDSAVH